MKFQTSPKKLILYSFLCLLAIFVILLVLGFNVLKFINHYPDDRDFLAFQANRSVAQDSQLAIESRLISVITEKNLTRALSVKNMGDIAELKKKGFLLEWPQGKNNIFCRFVSGAKGLWRDEKSALILPTQNQLRINLEIKKGMVFSFSMLALELLNADANRKIRIWLEDPKKKDSEMILLYQKIFSAYHRETFNSNSSMGNSDFSEIIPKTGWENIQIDLSDYETKEAVLCIEFEDEENQSDSLNFIANPMILKQGQPEKYNVIYLELDSVPADLMKIHYPDNHLTPFLSSKKEEWVSFNRMYSTASKTVPAYAGLILSQQPPLARHGLNSDEYPYEESRLFDSFIEKGYLASLPLILKKNGYFTQQTGNFEVSHILNQQGFDYGFDESFSFEKKPYDSTGVIYHIIRNIKSGQQKPFFLSAHLNAAYFSFSVPSLYYVKAALKSPGNMALKGKVLYLDYAISLIYRALEKSGLLEKTIFIISANHGGYLNREELNQGCQLKDDKIHVPFLVRLPLNLKNQIGAQNQEILTAVSTLQIAPAILDLLNIPEEKKFYGRSFKSLFSEKNLPAFNNEWLYAFDDYGIALIYQGRWKYILPLSDGVHENQVSEQVFDLYEDPKETKNLAFENPGLLKIFREQAIKSPYWPEVNMITVFPSFKKEGQEVTLEIQGSLNQEWINARFLNPETKADIQKIGNILRVKYKTTSHAQFFCWEQYPENFPVSINFSVDGKQAAKENVFYGQYSLTPIALPIQIKTKDEARVYLAFKKSAENPGNSDAVNFYYSRLDLRRFWKIMQ